MVIRFAGVFVGILVCFINIVSPKALLETIRGDLKQKSLNNIGAYT